MTTEELIERLLNVFQDLKRNFATRQDAWEENIARAELSCLREVVSERRNALAECLADIDQQILACSLSIEDYKRIHRVTAMLNERISQLGTEPVAAPEGLPGSNVADMMIARIQSLRSQGKL